MVTANCNGLVGSYSMGVGETVSIDDGSSVGEVYSNSSECYWLFKANPGDVLALSFSRFDLEEIYDTVTVCVGDLYMRDGV